MYDNSKNKPSLYPERAKQKVEKYRNKEFITHPANSTLEAPEKGVRYIQS